MPAVEAYLARACAGLSVWGSPVACSLAQTARRKVGGARAIGHFAADCRARDGISKPSANPRILEREGACLVATHAGQEFERGSLNGRQELDA